MSSDQWQALSPLLDEALEMRGEVLSIWLSSLRTQSPALIDQLEMLLCEYRALAEEGFLERGSVEFPSALSLAGQSLGVYRLIAEIDQGGMSSVWLAERDIPNHSERRK